MSGKISLAAYLFRRLKQHGVDAIHGVPGDFTLRAIDQLKDSGIKWVGTCNELNAGYAADGYARIKGLGALMTTYGVGELSAINALACSYAENVPVVHIVGSPDTTILKAAAKNPMQSIHHALPAQHPSIFAEIHEQVTVRRCLLTGQSKAVQVIDHTILRALKHRRPVYIRLPVNAVDVMVSDHRLTDTLHASFLPTSLKDDRNIAVKQRTDSYATFLIEKLERANFPLLLVDRAADLDTARQELNHFVRQSGIPTMTMPSGAGMIDHDIPNYIGVHSGPVGQIDTMPLIEQADLILAFGAMFSDTQTLGWKTVPSASKTIQIPNPTITDDSVHTKPLLASLTERLKYTTLKINSNPPSLLEGPNSLITQTHFYTRINPYIKPHDIILLGNATPILGGRDFILPSPTNRVICSGLSFSIGHMLPAALGAAIAQQHDASPPSQPEIASLLAANDVIDPVTHPSPDGRVILFDGDGSFQVTAQELSTIIRLRLNVTIFILNNAGYAYERLIHGPNEDYNDIPPWDYLSLPAAFGGREALKAAAEAGEEYGISCACLRSWGDLDAFLKDERFDNGFGGGKTGIEVG